MAEAVTGSVNASHPVTVTFSEFANLSSESTTQELPVYYALDTAQPTDWINAEDLNTTDLILHTSDSTADFNIWQRVKVGTQSAGTYFNKGVITFTLQNIEIP